MVVEVVLVSRFLRRLVTNQGGLVKLRYSQRVRHWVQALFDFLAPTALLLAILLLALLLAILLVALLLVVLLVRAVHNLDRLFHGPA
jgi:hypothetical protein